MAELPGWMQTTAHTCCIYTHTLLDKSGCMSVCMSVYGGGGGCNFCLHACGTIDAHTTVMVGS